MDLALLVYGISLLNGIGTFFGGLIILCVAVGAGNFIYWIDSHGDSATEGVRKRLWKAFGVAVVSAWVLILLPSEKTAYTMVGAYAAQKVAENDKVQQMSGKVLTIIEQKLDAYIDEGIKEAEDKVKKEKK
jgi:DNA topoisomerase VI subunit B